MCSRLSTANKAEMYVQESGRAGHDGQIPCALLVYGKRDLCQTYTSKHIIKYCQSESPFHKKSFLKALMFARMLYLKDICVVICTCKKQSQE